MDGYGVVLGAAGKNKSQLVTFSYFSLSRLSWHSMYGLQGKKRV